MADARVGVSRGVADDMARLSGLPRTYFKVVQNPIEQRFEVAQGALAEANRLWASPPGARVLAVETAPNTRRTTLSY